MSTDSNEVRRWSGLLEVPDEPVLCWAYGHRWDPGPIIERPGYYATVWEVRATCSCGRIRIDVLSPGSAALLNRNYYGGHGLLAGATSGRQESRAEWARRARARAAGVVDVRSRRRARQT